MSKMVSYASRTTVSIPALPLIGPWTCQLFSEPHFWQNSIVPGSCERVRQLAKHTEQTGHTASRSLPFPGATMQQAWLLELFFERTQATLSNSVVWANVVVNNLEIVKYPTLTCWSVRYYPNLDSFCFFCFDLGKRKSLLPSFHDVAGTWSSCTLLIFTMTCKDVLLFLFNMRLREAGPLVPT